MIFPGRKAVSGFVKGLFRAGVIPAFQGGFTLVQKVPYKSHLRLEFPGKPGHFLFLGFAAGGFRFRGGAALGVFRGSDRGGGFLPGALRFPGKAALFFQFGLGFQFFRRRFPGLFGSRQCRGFRGGSPGKALGLQDISPERAGFGIPGVVNKQLVYEIQGPLEFTFADIFPRQNKGVQAGLFGGRNLHNRRIALAAEQEQAARHENRKNYHGGNTDYDFFVNIKHTDIFLFFEPVSKHSLMREDFIMETISKIPGERKG
jgi:hypothetical protein